MDSKGQKTPRKSNIPQSQLLKRYPRATSQRASIDPRFRRERSRSDTENTSGTLIVSFIKNDGDAPLNLLQKEEQAKEPEIEIIIPNQDLEVQVHHDPEIPTEEVITEEPKIDNDTIAVLEEVKSTVDLKSKETHDENKTDSNISPIVKDNEADESEPDDFNTCILEDDNVTNDNNRLPMENSEEKPDVFSSNEHQLLNRRHIAASPELQCSLHESTDQSTYESIVNRETNFTNTDISEAPFGQSRNDIIKMLIIYGFGSCIGIFIAAVIIYILLNVILLVLSRILEESME